MLKKATHMFFILLAPLLFVQTSCKEEPTPPVIEQPQDTTSHNFVVTRIDTLGTLFSFANGVDIVDENNIWVAGIFTERDTNGEILYNKNLAHWDGERWTLMSIPMYGYNNTGPSPEELGAVKVFNDSLIFVVAKQDNSVAWWNGTKWTSSYVNEAVVSPHFWARSPTDMYFVANQGRATHWNGQTFTKINTGLTNPPLLDVWGDENAVYAVGRPGNFAQDGDESAFLYSSSATNWVIANRYKILDSLTTPPAINMGAIKSVYRENKNTKLWVLGGFGSGLLYEVLSVNPIAVKEFYRIPDIFYPFLVRGNADNDLFLFGALGSMWHYNGKSWQFIEQTGNFLVLGGAVKGNTITLVGVTRGEVVPYGMSIILQRK